MIQHIGTPVPPIGRAAPSPVEAIQEGAEPWHHIYPSAEFKELMAARWRFLFPAIIFFLAYYFALPLLNGLAPDLMKVNVFGHINLAYLFALSQFFMAWIVAVLYIRQAGLVFDPLAEKVRQLAAQLHPYIIKEDQ